MFNLILWKKKEHYSRGGRLSWIVMSGDGGLTCCRKWEPKLDSVLGRTGVFIILCWIYIGLGSILIKFFNFQFTEVLIVKTTVCFHPSASRSVWNSILLQLIPNWPHQWFLMSNTMLRWILLWGNFLGAKPLTAAHWKYWREQSHSAWWQRLMLWVATVLFVRKRGLFSHCSTLLLLSLSSPLCFYPFWPKPSDQIIIGGNRR